MIEEQLYFARLDVAVKIACAVDGDAKLKANVLAGMKQSFSVLDVVLGYFGCGVERKP